MSLKQPIGQKRLTNVALVKFKKNGKRFEIACYKNKVLNWRNGVEKELDDVLQTTSVFTNVSKGILAKHEDLQDVFGTQDEEKICMIILSEGEYQVSDKERDLEIESLFKDVASVLAEKCVNPHTSRPYTISMLERALKDVHFSVDLKRNAKQQALEVLPRLKEKISIERARMRLKTVSPKGSDRDVASKLRDLLTSREASIESEDATGSQISAGKGQVDVLSLGVMEQGDAHSQFDAWGSSSSLQPAKSLKEAEDRERNMGAVSYPGGPMASEPTPHSKPNHVTGTTTREKGVPEEDILYPQGPIAGLPEEFDSRRERFAELDSLQPGWTLELRKRRAGSAVDAVFFSPDGQQTGSFVAARRQALQSRKE